MIEYIEYAPILIVVLVFMIALLYCLHQYNRAGLELEKIIKFIKNFNKNDLNFRFKEIDTWMKSNPYISTLWSEFKNTFVFSESVALEGEHPDQYKYKEISSTVQNIQTTVDPLYFFNEETLVTSRFNYKMVQTIPTILTGCGPLFTFLNIAIAFGIIDFSSPEKTLESISGFMSSMQTAALVSVVAVASSLVYLMIERFLYGKVCKARLIKIQEIFGNLFASISSEKFLFELLRESKISNNSTENLIGTMPSQFKTAFNETMASNLVPYLENLIYGLNQLNKQLKETAKHQGRSNEVDDLF